MSITDNYRLVVLEKQGWDIRNYVNDKCCNEGQVFVGPLNIKDKQWGIGKTVIEAIDDAISAVAANGGVEDDE